MKSQEVLESTDGARVSRRALVPLGAVLLLMFAIGAGLAGPGFSARKEGEAATSRRSEERDATIVARSQSLTNPVRVGVLLERSDGWMTYRLDVDGRGLEISFPAVDWAIAEYSDEAGEIWQVRIFRRPAIFNQVQIYLQDAPGRYDGLSKQLSLISEQGGGAPALLDGVAAQKYEDVEVGLIEGGIRMIGTVFVVASRGLLIKLALRSSIEANNENQTLIDTQETFSVFESLRFFAVEPAAGDRN